MVTLKKSVGSFLGVAFALALLASPISGQSAQIQAAIRALLAGNNTWTGTNTFQAITVASCSGCGGGASWGAITGTLSNQTDLQNALNAKASLLGDVTFASVSVGTGPFASVGNVRLPDNGTIFALSDSTDGVDVRLLSVSTSSDPAFGRIYLAGSATDPLVSSTGLAYFDKYFNNYALGSFDSGLTAALGAFEEVTLVGANVVASGSSQVVVGSPTFDVYIVGPGDGDLQFKRDFALAGFKADDSFTIDTDDSGNIDLVVDSYDLTINGTPGVTGTGTCTITAITKGIITGASCI